MDMPTALRYLHRHYVAWLIQGQWQPELSMPEGCYPEEGEWIRIEWLFSEPLPQASWDAVERIVEGCFTEVCEVWVVCRDKQVSALAMAKTLSTPEKLAWLWVAAMDAAEETQREHDRNASCRISEPCQSFQALTKVELTDLNAWWTKNCEIPPQERREHRKRIQNYLKKGQYGHISGYVDRCLRRAENKPDNFWFWIPLVIESLWLQQKPAMSLLTDNLKHSQLLAQGGTAVIPWVRQTCTALKMAETQEDPIVRVTSSIHRDCSLPFSQRNLAEGLGLTPAYFSRLFEKRTGTHFTEYLTQARISRACELLCSGASLTEAAQASGFQRKSYFCEVFRKQTGMTAMQYRAMAKRGDEK